MYLFMLSVRFSLSVVKYISIKDKGKIRSVISSWSVIDEARISVVTDGGLYVQCLNESPYPFIRFQDPRAGRFGVIHMLYENMNDADRLDSGSTEWESQSANCPFMLQALGKVVVFLAFPEY